MVLLLPPAFWALRQIEMHNDVASWLPADDPRAVTLREFQQTFPGKDRILVSWDGSGLDDPRLLQFAIQLEGIPDSEGQPQGGSPYIDSVLTPHTLITRMRGVPVETAIERLEGILVGRGPLRLELTESGRNRGRFLIQELQQLAQDQLGINVRRVDTEEDSSWVAPSAEVVEEPYEPIPELDDYLAAKPLFDVALTWDGMHANEQVVDRFIKLATAMRGAATRAEPNGALLIRNCFFRSGSPVAVAVALTEAGSEDRSEAISAIYSAAEAVGIKPDAMHLGGRMVAGHELNQAVKKAGWDKSFPIWDLVHRSPMLFSFLVTVGFSFVLLRSVRLALLVMIVSLYTVGIALSLVPVTGGFMNMVLVVMPTLLMVLTTSAGIHLANYWRHAACDADGEITNAAAVIEAARTAAKPCMLASLTTAVGLLSLCSSTLVPVRDFGIYSAIGCVISLFVVLYGLPSLMLYWQSRTPGERELRSENWNRLGAFVYRFSRPVVLTCCIAGAICVYGLNWFRTETKVIRYFPEESRIVQDYRFIEENLSGIVPVDTVVRFDADGQKELNILQRMELVRRIQNKIQQHPDISGAISLATFQPETTEPGKEARSRQKMTYRLRAQQMQKKIHNALRRQYAGGATDDEEPQDGEDEEEGKQYTFSSLIALDQSTADGPEAVPDELWRISAQVAILTDLDYGVLMKDLDEIAQSELKLVGSPGTNHVVTGLVPVFLRTQQAVLESLIRSFGLAFAVIACVMILLLRDPLAGLITMIPNLFPVFAVFGLISYYGVRIDIGTMITASVALGIAVDGTLHLLTWFRRQLEFGDSRAEAVSKALEHCGPAMLQTSAAIGLGMLTLMPVELLLISRFGWLMAALIGVALIADIILLPALLAGFLGTLIERKIRRPLDDDTDATDGEETVPRPHVVVGDEEPTAIRHRAG